MESTELNGDLELLKHDSKNYSLKERETWGRRLDFLLACIGGSVGLGNVWRFPYLCYKNGGGAFLIPYFLSACLGGIPVFFLELAVGQFMSKGGPQAWTIVPLFQGIGLAATIVIFILSCYYNIILTWTIYYVLFSFTPDLPWEKCNHGWNTPNCSDNFSTTKNLTEGDGKFLTDPVTEFWENKVLKISEGLEYPGEIKWDLALCLLLVWVIVYICICKGIKSSGKVMYVTATSPYIFMLILVIRNCTLDGSSGGIEYYLKTNLTKLTETTVWVDAGTQIIYSWGIGMGTLTVLGSYNKFKHNSLRDAITFSGVNAGTSFFAGFIVFTILGFMAKQQGVSVSDVAESGPGLAFIAYPKAVAQLPFSPVWSVLFFMMLFLLGLDTQIVGVESVITAVVDQYPHLLRKGHRREIFIAVVCAIMFFIALSLVTEGGMYLLHLVDNYTGSRCILLVALSETIALCYCYGVGRFTDNIRMMIGDTWLLLTLPYFQICWTIFSPIFCTVMFAFSIYNYAGLTYKRPNDPEYSFPDWSVAIGWCVATSAIIAIPVVAIYKVVRLAWMGGRITQGDFRLLLVPYSLAEHQKRPQDRHEQCLADFEEKRQKHSSDIPFHKQNGSWSLDESQSMV